MPNVIGCPAFCNSQPDSDCLGVAGLIFLAWVTTSKLPIDIVEKRPINAPSCSLLDISRASIFPDSALSNSHFKLSVSRCRKDVLQRRRIPYRPAPVLKGTNDRGEICRKVFPRCRPIREIWKNSDWTWFNHYLLLCKSNQSSWKEYPVETSHCDGAYCGVWSVMIDLRTVQAFVNQSSSMN